MKGFILYGRKTEGSCRKSKYCMFSDNKCLLHILVVIVDDLHELREFYTNTERCTQCMQELALLYKYLKKVFYFFFWKGDFGAGGGVSGVGEPKLHELGSLGLHPLILAIRPSS